MQNILDYCIIALGRMGYGEKRLNDFKRMYEAVALEYADLSIQDKKDDDEVAYTKGCIDRELKAYLGSSFDPWEVRYSF